MYKVLSENVINCTNENDKQIMVQYETLEGEHLDFVREKKEFYEKFTDMKNKEKLLKVLNNRSNYV